MTELDRVADRMAAAFHAAGIRFAFGMPGGEVITFVDALERAGIRFILARNETAAAMMAAGTCADGRIPGLLVTTLGPGLANAINGIADAAQERVPLIVVSGVVDHALRARYTHQVVDHAALLAPLVKGSFEVEAEGADMVVARAIRLAMRAPFGPVHLDLAPGTAALPAPASKPRPTATRIAPRIDVRAPAFASVRERLARAERPLILAGFEAARSSRPQVFAEIAGTHGIPVLTTYKAKGLVDEHEACSLGAAGLSPLADKVLLRLLGEADLILLAGYDPIEMRQGWLDPVADDGRLIDIGAGSDHAMHRAVQTIEGPVDECFEALFAGHLARPLWRDGAPAAAREELQRLFRGPAGWGPHAIFETLQQLHGNAILTVDSGAHRILLSQRWKARHPLAMLQSAGWCTMGSALPLAIGASLARPDRNVIAVLGDGGLEMTLGELGTLRDQSIALTLLVLQDESLSLIAMKQDQSQLPRQGVALGATRFDLVAEAFGGRGVEVQNTEDLREALKDAETSSRFTLIACRIEAEAYVGHI